MLAFDLGGTLIEYVGVPLNGSEHYDRALGQAGAVVVVLTDVPYGMPRDLLRSPMVSPVAAPGRFSS